MGLKMTKMKEDGMKEPGDPHEPGFALEVASFEEF